MRKIAARFGLSFGMVGALLLGACGTPPPAAAPDPFLSLPDACEVLSRQTIQEIVGGTPGRSRSADAKTGKSCQWQYSADNAPVPPLQGVTPSDLGLSVTLYLYERLPSQQDVGGVQMASDSFAAGRNRQGVADSDSIDGIGDEAYGNFNDANGSLTFRTGNVIVELRYQGSGESQQGATGLGREAIHVALTKAAKDIPQHLRK